MKSVIKRQKLVCFFYKNTCRQTIKKAENPHLKHLYNILKFNTLSKHAIKGA